MSGGVKSGLLFGLIALISVIAVSFIPAVGPLVCGPGAAAIIGGVAGYMGVRWSAANAGIGTGVLAGTLAGVGAFIGSLIFFVVAVGLLINNPDFERQLQESLRQQQGAQVDPADVSTLMGAVGPIAGFCFGIFNLLISLALGALGGWIAVRNRSQAAPPTSYEPPPMAPMS